MTRTAMPMQFSPVERAAARLAWALSISYGLIGDYLQGTYRSERRPGEFIHLSVPDTGPLAPPAPSGKYVLEVAYGITVPSSVPGCE